MRNLSSVCVGAALMAWAVAAAAQSPPTARSPLRLGVISTPDFVGLRASDDVHVEYLLRGELAARARLGEEVVLREGTYRARVMQGERVVFVSPDRTVRAGAPQRLEVQWGALEIVARDGFGQRIKQPLRLNTPDGETDVRWTTSKRRAPVSWLVASGPVRLSSSRAKDGRGVDVWVPPGEVLSYELTLVRQAIQSAELGGRAQPAPQARRSAPFSWTVAGHAAFDQNQNRAGVENVQSLSLGVRTAMGLSWALSARHTLRSSVQFQHARASLGASSDVLRLRKKRDELRGGLEYEWALKPWLGVYAKAWGKAPAFGTYFEPDEDVRVVLRDAEGRSAVVPVAEGTSLRLWWPFTPLYTQQELGARVNVARTHDAMVHVEAGVAARQALYRGGLVLSTKQAGNVNAFRLSDATFYGPHASLNVDLNVTEVLHVSASCTALWDIEAMIDRQTPWPLLNISLKASVDLNEFIALEYVAEVHRDDYQLPDAQIFQGLQVALRYVLF